MYNITAVNSNYINSISTRQEIYIMTTVIYADILFFLNMFSDFIILYLTGIFSGNGISFRRTAVCAVLGALIGTAVLCINIKGFAVVLITFLTPLLLCFSAFGKKSPASFGSIIFYFYLSSVLLFGGMYAASSILQMITGNSAFTEKAIVVFLLMLGIALVYLIFSSLSEKGFRHHENLVKAEIYDGIKTYTLELLVDSGNFARDPFSQRPVTIISEQSLDPGLVEAVCNSETKNTAYTNIRPRVIPIKTVSGTALLYAFIPESMNIFINKKKLKANCIIAIDRRNNPFFGKDGIISGKLLKTL